LINTRVYLIGGGEFGSMPATMFEIKQLVLSPTGNGSFDIIPLENMKFARHGHSCCSLGENYIVVTGSRKDVDRAPWRTEIYNTVTNKWTELG
jgi:hypothetical protein